METTSTKKSTSGSTASKDKVSPKKDAAAGLRELLVDSLKDIYWAENALLKAIPKMSANATSKELSSALDAHLKQTKTQVGRLEKAFDLLGEKAQGKKCLAMEGILKEGEEILEETEPGAVRDAGIIAAGQKVEHYEIATYGTLAAWAKTLGEKEVLHLLVESLHEEKEADTALTDKAYNSINFEATETSEE